MAASRRCQRCGHKNPRDFRFCEQCGSRLPPPAPRLRAAHPSGWLAWVALVALLVAGAYWLGAQTREPAPAQTGGTTGEIQPAETGYRIYENPEYGFRMEIPAMWIEGDPGTAIVRFDHPQIPSMLAVGTEPLAGSLADYVRSRKQQLVAEGVDVVDEYGTTVNGMEAHVIVGRFWSSQLGFMKGKEGIIKVDGQVFVVTATISESYYPVYEPVFDRVIHSFETL